MKHAAPTVLIVIDGLGVRRERHANAFALARTPTLDRLRVDFPSTELAASGLDVGLPPGRTGNSEVGHLNLGAGRVVYDEPVRISRAIDDGGFFSNPDLKGMLQTARQSALHLVGLVSDGGVHSSLEHLAAFIRAAADFSVTQVYIHALTDGRDTPPKSALSALRHIEQLCTRYGTGEVASVCGRFYGMDRDRRWERTTRAYHLLTKGAGIAATSAEQAVLSAYERGETDEFIQPTFVSSDDKARGIVNDGDALAFFNFRADRMHQLVAAFALPDFREFVRQPLAHPGRMLSLTTYDERWPMPAMFTPQQIEQTLGAVLAEVGCSQLRIAEAEKFAHVGYFFNGGSEAVFPGEERVLIPSARELQPQMALDEVTRATTEAIAAGAHDFILVNLANPDMIGHAGDLDAAITAVEAVDGSVGAIVQATLAKKGRVIVTSDHGNCELMVDADTGEPHTSHTLSPVPLIVVDPAVRKQKLRPGALSDVAPTVLALMDLPAPQTMTGRSLLGD
jgi:2,3-bisphosphoglycerate-independent phosphoglycerate mutase